MSSSHSRYRDDNQRDSRPRREGRHGDGREERRYADRKDDLSSRPKREYEGNDRDEHRDRRNDTRNRGYDRNEGRSTRADRDRPRDHDRRDGPSRDHEHDRDQREPDRPNERRRSASPRSRQHSSRPHVKSPSPSVPPEEKAKPNFGASGLLAAETNTVRKADGSSTLLKYNEPPEARKPAQGWRLYVFKGKEDAGAFQPPACGWRVDQERRYVPYCPPERVSVWPRPRRDGHRS
jgi:smad nuclear-interacting protein 1